MCAGFLGLLFFLRDAKRLWTLPLHQGQDASKMEVKENKIKYWPTGKGIKTPGYAFVISEKMSGCEWS